MNVEFSKRFIKQQLKLASALQKRIDDRLLLFRDDPFNPQLNNHALHHPYDGCRSINITGDIRAIYELKGETILFVAVGSHSELYK
jgi:addiction module RelE/StbE family toxin